MNSLIYICDIISRFKLGPGVVGRAAVIALVVVVDLGAALRLVGAVIAVYSTLVVVVMVLVVVVVEDVVPVAVVD